MLAIPVLPVKWKAPVVSQLRRLVHTNWKTRVSALWKFVCTHRCSYDRDYIFRKRTTHCLYLHFSNLSYNAFLILKIIINALSFVWAAINRIACWTALLLWLQAVWKENKRTHCMNQFCMNLVFMLLFQFSCNFHLPWWNIKFKRQDDCFIHKMSFKNDCSLEPYMYLQLNNSNKEILYRSIIIFQFFHQKFFFNVLSFTEYIKGICIHFCTDWFLPFNNIWTIFKLLNIDLLCIFCRLKDIWIVSWHTSAPLHARWFMSTCNIIVFTCDFLCHHAR